MPSSFTPAFNPATPGAIGGTTPSTIVGTTITSTAALIGKSVNINSGVFTVDSVGNINSVGFFTGGSSGQYSFQGTTGQCQIDGGLIQSDGAGNLEVVNIYSSNGGELIAGSLPVQITLGGDAIGDLHYSIDTSGTQAIRAIGATNTVLTVIGGIPTWAPVTA
jgi:hypothetical protein